MRVFAALCPTGERRSVLTPNATVLRGPTRPSKTAASLRAGLIGRGIQLSYSPRMHESEGVRLGLNYSYRLFDFDLLDRNDADLPNLIAWLRDKGYAGLNITHPFKEQVIATLDRLSPEASAIGAVNTVVFQADAAVGHNTDCWGFAESFQRGLPHPRLDCVVLIGTGGAGMAVAHALLGLGVKRLAVADSIGAKARQLAARLNDQVPSREIVAVTDLAAALATADGMVNATPVGMVKYPGIPVEAAWLRPEMWVADIVYFPAETELLQVSESIGCRILPGTGMAVFQAVMAFKLITGVAPDPDQMAKHFDR